MSGRFADWKVGVLVSLASALIGPALRADWHVAVVGGPGYDQVVINALDGATAVGEARHLTSPIGDFPAVWDANNPATTTMFGSLQGRIVGGSEGRYVGSLFSSGGAVLWQGSPENWIDLTPAATRGATAHGVCGDQQVGLTVSATSVLEAALWRGSAASWVDLAPAGAVQSVANATDGTLQGGFVQIGYDVRAALWHGTAATLTYLGPTGHSSMVRSMAPGQQVGFLSGISTGGTAHAALWRGTPESFVDLNPPGYGLSDLFGTCGSAQVGYANSGGFAVGPGIWFGTAASFQPLPVPSGYAQGVATCISQVDGLYYIGGHAISSTTGEQVALLWVGVPAPPAAAPLVITAILIIGSRRRN